jgi:hypothetical protein
LDLPTIVDPTDDEVKDVLEQPVVFFDTAGCEFFEKNEGDDDVKGKGGGRIGEGSKSNENEADVVVKWAKKLVRKSVCRTEEIADLNALGRCWSARGGNCNCDPISSSGFAHLVLAP